MIVGARGGQFVGKIIDWSVYSKIKFLCTILLIISVQSCTKEGYARVELVPNSTVLHQYLTASIQSREVLHQVTKGHDTLCIVFDSELVYKYLCPSAPLITLGVDGFWYQDGGKTCFSSDDVPVLEIIDGTGKVSGDLCAVSEGYTAWTFHFIDQDPIVIVKSIYAENYDDRMMSINHRGFCADAPENTLPAYRLSRLKGFNYAETDVRFTSDGVPVLLHDAEIDRTSDGNGKVAELKFEQIRGYDFGGWKSSGYKGTQIPSLDEFLNLCRKIDLRPVLELKSGSKSQVHQIVEMVEKYGLKDATIYISFSQGLLKAVIEKDSTARVGFLSGEVVDNVIASAKALKTTTNQVVVDANDYSESAVSKCKAAELPLWIWTVNSEKTIRSLSPYITSVTSDKVHAGLLLYGGQK